MKPTTEEILKALIVGEEACLECERLLTLLLCNEGEYSMEAQKWKLQAEKLSDLQK